eukprot:Pgem_evm1s17735
MFSTKTIDFLFAILGLSTLCWSSTLGIVRCNRNDFIIENRILKYNEEGRKNCYE